MSLLHTVPVLKVDMLAPSCDRCGRGFKAKRKNCHNCGVQVCEECSSYKTRLPQFGYHKPVRCCSYCSHFLYVYKMDDAALAKLNIKTLKRYLASYNISTHGMLEKQELIKAIQENRPLPDASEVYFRKNTPDTVEKSTIIQEEIYSTATHYQQGSGEGRFWDLDKFFSKLFKNDDSPPKPPQRPEPAPTSPQKPQAAPNPRPQSYQPQPQPQPHPHPQPTKQHPAGSFDFTQQPQPQSFQQQQYGYPPMPTPQPGGNVPNGAMPAPNAAPFTAPTGASPNFFPPGTTPSAQGYYAAYPPGTVPNQNGYSTFHNHTQYQQQPYTQGTQSGFHTTADQQQAYQQGYQQTYQQTYQQYPPQQGQQQQHPFAQFQPGSPFYDKQPQHQQQQHQSYQHNQQPHYQQQQQHYTQQPQPAPFPAPSAADIGSTNYLSSQFKPQTAYQPKATPQAASSPKPVPQPTHTPQTAPRPMPVPPQAAPRSTPTTTPQAASQPTPQSSRPTSTSRPSTKSSAQEQETSRPQTTPRPTSTYTSNSTSSSQSRPVPPTPKTPPHGPRAPQDRNDYSGFGSYSGTTPEQSSSSYSHSHQSSTSASDPRSTPRTEASPPPPPPPPPQSTPRPPRQSNRGPQTEHSTSLLTIEEIVSASVDPSTLSIKVIKSLLDTNCVSYVGVVEKSDLVSQLQKLMISTKAEQERLFNEQEKEKAAAAAAAEAAKKWQTEQQQQQQQQKSSSTATAPTPQASSANSNGGGPGAADDEHLCKICYEASLNCVMLNCGHMSTCMDCGKKVMDGPRVCPICREYVLKLLHVFRA
ncbi:RING finger protein 34 [Mortierella sp. 14UC]|nr:RING finger protein 34 [Mortierella sp. 14UC]